MPFAMPVVQCPPEILRTGHPSPVSVRDATGHLLMAKGVMLETDEQRLRLVSRTIFVDEREGELIRRAMGGKLDALLRQNTKLGEIYAAKPDGASIAPVALRKEGDSLPVVCANLQMHLSQLLRDPPPADLLPRVDALQREVLALVDAQADALLLLLVHQSASDAHRYSATHALLVAVLCELASRQLPHQTALWRESLRCAALTMNITMATMQDQLALQEAPPSPQQRTHIDAHAHRGGDCLRAAGVTDPLWLAAVEHHHAAPSGVMTEQDPGVQLARLLNRADVFSARLSMRKQRAPMSAASAIKAAYLDEHQQADEAGWALIQATGFYPPGSFVRLKSGELAVVLRRGAHAKTPKVASLIGRSGTPLAEIAVRDTRVRPHEVDAGITPSEVRVRLNMEKLLKL
jgi:HD-GYP domain-containing protein (c-di-GMP phosphodiesterase class II)